MTNEEHISDLEALEGQLVSEEPEQPLSPEEEAQAQRQTVSKGQIRGLVGLGLTATYAIKAPNWQVMPEELEDATDATMNAIEHYFPDINDFDHPLLILGVALAMPAIPRIAAGVPMKLPAPDEQLQEEKEQELAKEPVKENQPSEASDLMDIADLNIESFLKESN